MYYRHILNLYFWSNIIYNWLTIKVEWQSFFIFKNSYKKQPTQNDAKKRITVRWRKPAKPPHKCTDISVTRRLTVWVEEVWPSNLPIWTSYPKLCHSNYIGAWGAWMKLQQGKKWIPVHRSLKFVCKSLYSSICVYRIAMQYCRFIEFIDFRSFYSKCLCRRYTYYYSQFFLTLFHLRL